MAWYLLRLIFRRHTPVRIGRSSDLFTNEGRILEERRFWGASIEAQCDSAVFNVIMSSTRNPRFQEAIPCLYESVVLNQFSARKLTEAARRE